MPVPLPLVLGGGGLLLGLGWLLLGGSSSTPSGPRGPYLTDVPVPPNGVTWEQVDAAMCLAYEAGATTGEALLAGVLSRLWPQVPWPSQIGDAHSIREVQQLVGGRVGLFVQKLQQGQPVCADEPPPPPPPPGKLDDITPFFTGEPGGFGTIVQGGNPTLTVRGAYSLGASETGKIRNALACMATTGFNLLFYSRPWPGNDYGRGQVGSKYYDIARAWNPANDNAQAIAVQHASDPSVRMRRQISWSGQVLKQGSYGAPFLPPMKLVGQSLVCQFPTWAPERNPPPEVLAALGWTLEEMEAAWNARPGTG